jgi:hypothetical protein
VCQTTIDKYRLQIYRFTTLGLRKLYLETAILGKIYICLFVLYDIEQNRLVLHGLIFLSKSKRSECAALGHCRQNVVASINGIFFSLFLLGLLFSEKGLS